MTEIQTRFLMPWLLIQIIQVQLGIMLGAYVNRGSADYTSAELLICIFKALRHICTFLLSRLAVLDSVSTNFFIKLSMNVIYDYTHITI